ncbi:MAG: glycerate kinase [Oligoflexales bacterium]|nr:glycerate kinase [Oligoflexales bacterium]
MNEDCAVIESAKLNGIALKQGKRLKPLEENSGQIGTVIRFFLDQGIRKFVIGIGGTSSTDGGVGMVQELGGQFLDHDNRQIHGGGGSLLSLSRIDLNDLDPRAKESCFIGAADVINQFSGKDGAAQV